MTREDGSWLTGSSPPPLSINLAPKSIPSTVLGSKKGNLRTRSSTKSTSAMSSNECKKVNYSKNGDLDPNGCLAPSKSQLLIKSQTISCVQVVPLNQQKTNSQNDIQVQMIFGYRILGRWLPMCRLPSVESCKSDRRSWHTRGTGRNRQVCLEPIRRHSCRNHFETGRLKFQESIEIPRSVDFLPL